MYSLDDLRSSFALLDYRSDHGESVVDILTEVGLKVEDVLHVAEQRGMRAALVATGDKETLARVTSSVIPLPVHLTPEQSKMMNVMAACEVEAIAATLMMVRKDSQ